MNYSSIFVYNFSSKVDLYTVVLHKFKCATWWVSTCLHLCNPNPCQDIESSPQKVSLCPFQANLRAIPPEGTTVLVFSHHRWDLPVSWLHITGVIQYVLRHLRLFHSAYRFWHSSISHISLICSLLLLSRILLCKYTSLFIFYLSPGVGCLVTSWFGAILNKAALNLFWLGLCGQMFYFSWVSSPGEEPCLLGFIRRCQTFYRSGRPCPRLTGVPVAPCPHWHFDLAF